MSDFLILDDSRRPVNLSEGMPAGYEQQRLCGAVPYVAKGDFGTLLFQHYTGQEVEFWYSHYLLKRPATFRGEVNTPILELQVPWLQAFASSWDGMDHVRMREHQFELTYAPFANTLSRFEPDTEYRTFDMHFTPVVLAPYAAHCRRLSIFLEQAGQGKAVNLLDCPQFLGPDMVRIIRSIVNLKEEPGLATSYFNALAQEFLTLLTIQVAAMTDKPSVSALQTRKAQEARAIIVSDFEENHSVAELATMTGTTEVNLQLAFKQVYGTTVYKFSRQARLEHALHLLQTTNYPNRVISQLTGYPDEANFSRAFFQHFGYRPGAVQRNRKQ